MPRGNRTGPLALGSMIGRRMGYCAGFPAPGFMNPGPGFGFGRGFRKGFGRGHGWCRCGFNPLIYPFYPLMHSPSPHQHELASEEELNLLKEQAEFFRKQMEKITKRIKELKNKKMNRDKKDD